MDDFFDTLNLGISSQRAAVGQPRIGVVTSSDSQKALAKVLLQPEGVLTGWLPVLTQWCGSGWGLTCPPSPGDQVLILPLEGDPQHGLIVGRFFSNIARPPNADPGELNLTHKSGCSIQLLNSGIIAIRGDLHVSGDVYDAHGALSELRNDYNIHTHQTSNGQITSIPTPQD